MPWSKLRQHQAIKIAQELLDISNESSSVDTHGELLPKPKTLEKL
ncbi:MAG: hypothetical protein V7K88_09970 [Nostoc sp.]